VISGEVAAIMDAEAALSAEGARKVIRLAVSIPSHCPLMSEAQAEFNQVLDDTPMEDPCCPIIGNVNGSPMHTAEEIKTDLGSQLISRVRWNESMQSLLAQGVTRCFEIGSGKVLSGLMRRIDRSIPTTPIDSPNSLSSISDHISKAG
jgi:[acyl-carrier-protein] S-malonyltransferase